MTPRDALADQHGLTPALADELANCLDVALAGDGATFYANSDASDTLRERGLLVPTQHVDGDGLVGNVYRFSATGRAAVLALFGVDLAPAKAPATPRLAPVVRLADRRPGPACPTCGGKGGSR